MSDAISTGEVKRILGVSATRVHQLAESGSLDAIWVKGKRLFDRHSVETFLSRRHFCGVITRDWGTPCKNVVYGDGPCPVHQPGHVPERWKK